MVYEAFLLGLITLVSPLLVSSAVIPATPIHNCSGEAAPAPTTYKPYFHSYGPQLRGNSGWEEWTFVLPDTLNQSMYQFRWTRGDPAAFGSTLDTATFSAAYEKIGFTTSVTGQFEYKAVDETSMSISIGNNVLSFDGTQGPYGLWSLSVDAGGLQVDIAIDSVLPDVPFDPTLNGQKGLLVPGYYVSHPIYRGHIDGTVTLPSGDNWVTREVATLKHAYGYTPVQNMLSTYTRASIFVGASTLNWYLAEDTNRQDTTAAQFVYGAVDLSEVTLKYQTTNEPSILKIGSSVSSESRNYHVTLAGCPKTSNHPYVFNTTSLFYLGAVKDSAGGTTEYWSLDTHVSFFIDGQPWTNNATIGSLGHLEVYTSPNNW